jgi:hypothetical protein
MGAEAEPMSVRCDGQYVREPQPYFVTFDIEKNHFMFERAGANIVTGEIISTNDEQLDLSLRGIGGRVLLSFNRKRNIMTWPGLPAGELGRFVMQHTCTPVTGRTVHSMFDQPEQFDPKRLDPLDAFSLSRDRRCGRSDEADQRSRMYRDKAAIDYGDLRELCALWEVRRALTAAPEVSC